MDHNDMDNGQEQHKLDFTTQTISWQSLAINAISADDLEVDGGGVQEGRHGRVRGGGWRGGHWEVHLPPILPGHCLWSL